VKLGWRIVLPELLLVASTAAPASAYRPFVSTDAAVADPGAVEIELGYFSVERARGESTFTTPSVVLNYGLVRNWEAVAEFGIVNSPGFDITDPALSLKGVLREGILQEKPGLSVAVEASLLLPSTRPDVDHFGFQGVAIVSAGLGPFIVHVNGGGGVDRVDTRPFGIWGVIGELPVVSRLRVVGEVAGEDVRGERPVHSALIGLIWQVASSVSVDAGVRLGLTEAAPDWQFTAGVTFAFGLPFLSRAARKPD